MTFIQVMVALYLLKFINAPPHQGRVPLVKFCNMMKA